MSAVSSALPRTGREVQLVLRPAGAPVESDFRVVEAPIHEPKEGQILVRNTWMSLDPSARIRMDDGDSTYMPPFRIGAPLEGWAVGQVVASRSPRFRSGDSVLHQLGWREYATLEAGGVPGDRADPVAIDVDSNTHDRAYLGPLGWVGLTSYVGLLYVAELRADDVVFVSASAGAVGSLAVQIAKLRGHSVIGSVGSAAKAAYVRDTLGADASFCYRDGDMGDLLRKAAPDGIDVYFDNVGGRHLEAALDSLRLGGRVALCGAVSSYNAGSASVGPSNIFQAVVKSLTLRGFLARRYADRMPEFRDQMRTWLREGRIVYPETVVEGIGRAPLAFIGLLGGANTGKMLVKLT